MTEVLEADSNPYYVGGMVFQLYLNLRSLSGPGIMTFNLLVIKLFKAVQAAEVSIV